MKKLIVGLMVMAMTFLVGSAMTIGSDTAFAANTKDAVCDGIGKVGGVGCGDDDATNEKADNLVAEIIDIFSWVVGVAAVIMVIVGGFKYVTSGGDSGKIGSAKNTIIYALIGLVIVALAQVIVIFVINKVT